MPDLTRSRAFASFSVDDVSAAAAFYGETLGLDVSESDGLLDLALGGGGHVLIYGKGDGHVPASFTVLNFPVADVAATVDELTAAGIAFERYEGFDQDEHGVAHNAGPLIAWFTDPAGNVVSVIEDVT